MPRENITQYSGCGRNVPARREGGSISSVTVERIIPHQELRLYKTAGGIRMVARERLTVKKGKGG